MRPGTRTRLTTGCATLLLSLSAAGQAALADALVVLNKAEGTASLIDVETGAVEATVPTGQGPHEAAASPDGSLVVVCNYGGRTPGSTLTLIDVLRKRAARTIGLGDHTRPHGVAFLPDGKRVVVTSETSRKLLVVNVETGEVEQAIDTGAEGSHMVALSPDAHTAYVANIRSGSLSVIDLRRGELVKVLPTGAGAEGIAVRPGAGEIWVTNRQADTVSVVDPESLTVTATIDVALTQEEKDKGLGLRTPGGGQLAFPIRVQFTPDGKRALVSCAGAGVVRVFDAASRQEVGRVAMDAPAMDDEGRLFGGEFGQSPVPVGIVVDPAGRRAYVASTRADIVTVIDLASLRIVTRLRAGREPDGMAYSTVDWPKKAG